MSRPLHSPLTSLALLTTLLTLLLAPATLQASFCQTLQTHPRAFVAGSPLPADRFPLQIVLVGPLPEQLPRQTIEQALEDSINTWNNVPCADLDLRYKGYQDDPSTLDKDDLPIAFATPGEEPCFPDLGFAAYTNYICNTAPRLRIFLDAREGRWSAQADPLRASLTSDGALISTAVDLPSILTHELGHALGLGHSTTDLAATMAALYLNDGSQATLALDDLLGICSLYPAEQPRHACQSDQDCPRLFATCNTSALPESNLCQEHRAQPGDYCAADLQHCPQLCLFTSPDTLTGYCSLPCTQDDDCPDSMQCTTHPLEEGTVCQLDPPPLTESSCQLTSTSTPPAPSHTPLLLLLILLTPGSIPHQE